MGALDGIRVVDFGQYVAGPLAGMLLADQGADVVRVEPPGGPRWDTPANATWNRGKQSIILDLKDPADAETARRLVATADVLIENFRPGVMDRLGLGHEAMGTANPRLVYCSLPGFASDDPRANVPAWEGVVAAATGTYLNARGNRPVYTAIPISSSYAAMLAAVGIAVALNARERDGAGQRIEIPLFDATFQALGVRGQRAHSAATSPLGGGGVAWVRQYECKDGRWVQFHAANSRFVNQFLDVAGASSWREEGFADRQRAMTDPEFAKELLARMIALFKTKTAQEWEDLVNAAGTPCAVCRNTAEWMEHPHARESGMVVQLDDPNLGPMRQPGIQAQLSATPGAIRSPAPLPGADRDRILTSLSSPASATRTAAAPREVLAALHGVRVLDLCIILAGPTCGRTLAEFGADVIKIDNPAREGGIAFHLDVNRGKRSILLDLNKPEAQEVFWALAGQADVIVQNYRQGSIEKLGIDYESVRKRRPDIVYASLNAYGGSGPWAKRPGWEQLAQAATGMQKRYGGDGPPVLQPFPVNDYGTGFMGAYAVALALLHRRKTGQGQHVQTALARTACTLQSVFFNDYEGKTWDEPRGQDCLGSGAMNRLYQASDGWFFLALTERQSARIGAVPGLQGAPAGGLEHFLEEQFAKESCDEWCARLASAGFGAHRATTVEEIIADPWVQAHGLSLTRDHEPAGLVTHIGPSARFSTTPMQPGRPTPAPGSDAASVLREIGRAEDIDALVRCGALVIEGVQGR